VPLCTLAFNVASVKVGKSHHMSNPRALWADSRRLEAVWVS